MKNKDFKQFKEGLFDSHAKLIKHLHNQSEGQLPGRPNHSHAWRGTWERPMGIDEDTQHPFTIARMTDHNVRGRDR